MINILIKSLMTRLFKMTTFFARLNPCSCYTYLKYSTFYVTGQPTFQVSDLTECGICWLSSLVHFILGVHRCGSYAGSSVINIYHSSRFMGKYRGHTCLHELRVPRYEAGAKPC